MVASSPAVMGADDEHYRNNLQLGLTYSNPLADPKIDLTTGRESLEVDKDTGFYVGYEVKLTHILGLRFGFASQEYDLDVSSGPARGHLGGLETKPFTANLLLHPRSRAPIDFYIGGGFAYVTYGGLSVPAKYQNLFADDPSVSKLNFDNDKTVNAELGANFKFGDSHFGLNIDGQYIKTTAASDHVDVKVDPFTAGAALLFYW
jgi:hypothetical protein